MRLRVSVPPDASLLSSTLYEGIAYLLSEVGGNVSPEYIELPDNAFVKAFRGVGEDVDGLNNLRIATALNDYRSINSLLKSLGIKEDDFWPEKKSCGKAKIVSYGHLIRAVSSVARDRPEALMR